MCLCMGYMVHYMLVTRVLVLCMTVSRYIVLYVIVSRVSGALCVCV